MRLNKLIKCSTGSIEDMLDAFEDRIAFLDNDISMACNVQSDEILAVEDEFLTDVNSPNVYDTYREFANTLYPDFDLSEEEIEDEIWAIEDELYTYGADINECPTYWRDDYEEPVIFIKGSYYYVNFRGSSCRFVLIDDNDELLDLGLI